MAGAEREERFTRLVHEHGDAVYRYLRRRFHSAEGADAEDLLADVMAVAWRRLDDIPVGAELPWLYGVARRRLSNARTRSARRERLAAPVRHATSADSAEDLAVADLSLQAAMAQLPDKEREVLTLTAWEGLRPSELAVALGVSVNAAAVRLSKAKAHLLTLLAGGTAERVRVVATETS